MHQPSREPRGLERLLPSSPTVQNPPAIAVEHPRHRNTAGLLNRLGDFALLMQKRVESRELREGEDPRLYVLGGDSGASTPTRLNQIYNPTTNTWTIGAAFAGARDFAAAAALSDGVHLVGAADR